MGKSDEFLEYVHGGNEVTKMANTFWGKTVLALCRSDVRNALNDEKFTDELLKVLDKPSEVKSKFDKIKVHVSQSEVDFCCKLFKEHCK